MLRLSLKVFNSAVSKSHRYIYQILQNTQLFRKKNVFQLIFECKKSAIFRALRENRAARLSPTSAQRDFNLQHKFCLFKPGKWWYICFLQFFLFPVDQCANPHEQIFCCHILLSLFFLLFSLMFYSRWPQLLLEIMFQQRATQKMIDFQLKRANREKRCGLLDKEKPSWSWLVTHWKKVIRNCVIFHPQIIIKSFFSLIWLT